MVRLGAFRRQSEKLLQMLGKSAQCFGPRRRIGRWGVVYGVFVQPSGIWGSSSVSYR